MVNELECFAKVLQYFALTKKEFANLKILPHEYICGWRMTFRLVMVRNLEFHHVVDGLKNKYWREKTFILWHHTAWNICAKKNSVLLILFIQFLPESYWKLLHNTATLAKSTVPLKIKLTYEKLSTISKKDRFCTVLQEVEHLRKSTQSIFYDNWDANCQGNLLE